MTIQIKAQSKVAFFAFMVCVALQFVFLNESLASTGTTMAAPLKSVNDLISGDMAKIIAGISFAFALLGCVVKFNVHAIATAFGVAITAGAGPSVVQALVTATF